MKIIGASDIHGSSHALSYIGYMAKHNQVDLIVLAGDITLGGFYNNFIDLIPELSKQGEAPVILIPGNHDYWKPFQKFPDKVITSDNQVVCLVNEPATYKDINFYGTPWTPKYGDWNYMLPEQDIVYDIPLNTDVLICHGPPYGIGDFTRDQRRVGSYKLTRAIETHPKLQAVFFGHNHGQGGYCEVIAGASGQSIHLFNVACLDDNYEFNPAGVAIHMLEVGV